MQLALLIWVIPSGFIGAAVGVYAFFGVWIWLMARLGYVGLILGWVPALLVFAAAFCTAGVLWLPAIVFARLYRQRSSRKGRPSGVLDVIDAPYRVLGEALWRSPAKR